jgi:hypothetical protein
MPQVKGLKKLALPVWQPEENGRYDDYKPSKLVLITHICHF